MSTATTRPSGPGAAIDHGLVPSRFSRPPQGAIAGLALVVRTATQPSWAARRVKYMAVPKWLELRTPTTPTPWVAGPLDGQRAGALGEHLADAVAAVEQQQGAGVGQDRGVGDGAHGAGAEPRRVPGQAQEAVGLVAPQVGLHEAVGDQGAPSSSGTPREDEHPVPNARRLSGEIRSGAMLALVSWLLYTVCIHNPATEGRRCSA